MSFLDAPTVPAVWKPPAPPGLYLSEAEIAARVGVGLARWKSLAPTLERDGLPKKNVLIGKRYWPKVRQFLDTMEGMTQAGSPTSQQRKENWK